MKATDDLVHEHRAVERMLRVLEAVQAKPAAAQDVPSLREAVEFCRVFVDACHHYKEESLLFPSLRDHDVPGAEEAIARLEADHKIGRELVGRLDLAIGHVSAGEKAALSEVGDIIRQYAELLRRHIPEEEQGVFALADESLPPDVQDELAAGYDDVERDVVGEGRHEAFHEMLDRLEAAYV